MAGYTLNAAGTYQSRLTGGNFTNSLPSFNVGDLLLLHTGANSTTLAAPTISGWTKLSPNSNAKCAALYARIAVNGDTMPTFQWDASREAYAGAFSFSGDVWPDVTTISNVSSDRSTNAVGGVAVPGITPTQDRCLFIRCGHGLKTSLNDGSSFLDWTTNSGIFTRAGQIIPTGSRAAACLWYVQQGAATNYGLDTSFLTNTPDTNANTQGVAIALRAATVPTAGTLNPTGNTPSVVGATATVLTPLTAREALKQKAREVAAKIFLPPRRILLPA